ncbi:MAG TPA: fused MFS/spermidine synthase [Prolixibacteraceae bacterium]|nr:fused MFS/spermidine synthase [Prolixibacteraceae bacterium]
MMNRKHWMLFLVLVIEGASLMAVELIGSRLIAPFYGNSLYVWTAILCCCVSGLALGYYSGGVLSRRHATPKILFSILTVAALLVFALPYTSKALISFTSVMGLISGICITGFVLMTPIMLCFGMVGPMIVKLMSSSIESLGNVSGTTYFTSTAGGILATFLFGLYLIPLAGLNFCIYLTAIALAILPIIYTLVSLPAKKNKTFCSRSTNPTGVAPAPKKAKKVDRMEVSNSVFVYGFAVIEGASVMAIELISARMLAPWFGSSLPVWATVIGITLLGLAVGYFAGGRVADQFPQRNTLSIVLLGTSFLTLLMHIASQRLPLLFAEFNPILSLITISLLMILPPLAMLGMIPTLLIRFITSKIDDSGSTTGKVFTVSSISGIITLPLIGFWVVPEFGLTFPSIVIGILIGIVPFFQLIKQKKYYGWILLPAAFFSFLLTSNSKNEPGIKVQYLSEGLLGQVMVADVDQAISEGKDMNGRMLFVNRMGQSQLDLKTGSTRWTYSIFTSAVSSVLPMKSKALILGLGGGNVANSFSYGLGFQVDAVELDRRIADVSRQYFSLNPNVNVIVDDARHYLETTSKKYDLIFFDVFKGEVQPPHVLSVEAFKSAKSLLSENGLIIVNLNGYLTGKIGKPGRSVYRTLKAAGLETRILPTPGNESERNSLFIATKKPMAFHHVRTPLTHQGKEVGLDSLFLDPSTLNLSDAIILTDDKPILELLNVAASNKWRNDYNGTYNLLFAKSGIPLFK